MSSKINKLFQGIDPNECGVYEATDQSNAPLCADGDMAVYYKTAIVNSEDLAIVLYKGIPLMRTIVHHNGTKLSDYNVTLIPEGKKYTSQNIAGEDLKNLVILGRVLFTCNILRR